MNEIARQTYARCVARLWPLRHNPKDRRTLRMTVAMLRRVNARIAYARHSDGIYCPKPN